MNWIVMNSTEGYACVLKLKKQEEKIRTTNNGTQANDCVEL